MSLKRHVYLCQICLCDLDEDAYACPCGHVFHEMCILHWFEVKPECPACKNKFRRAGGMVPLTRLFFTREEKLSQSQSLTAIQPQSPSGENSTFAATNLAAAQAMQIEVFTARQQHFQEQVSGLISENTALKHQVSELEALVVTKDAALKRSQLDAIQSSRETGMFKRQLKEKEAEIKMLRAEKWVSQYTSYFIKRELEEGPSASESSTSQQAVEELCRKIKKDGEGWKPIIMKQHAMLEQRANDYRELLKDKKKVQESEKHLREKVSSLEEQCRKLKEGITMPRYPMAPRTALVHQDWQSARQKEDLPSQEMPKSLDFKDKMEKVSNKENAQVIQGSVSSNKCKDDFDFLWENESSSLVVIDDLSKKRKREAGFLLENQKPATSFLSKVQNKASVSTLNNGTFIKKGYNHFGILHTVRTAPSAFQTQGKQATKQLQQGMMFTKSK